MLKVNNKDTNSATPCSSVSIVNFKHVNADWVRPNINVASTIVPGPLSLKRRFGRSEQIHFL